MSAEQILEKYISEHPDYWEFEDEANEVARLENLCNNKTLKQNVSVLRNTPSFSKLICGYC